MGKYYSKNKSENYEGKQSQTDLSAVGLLGPLMRYWVLIISKMVGKKYSVFLKRPSTEYL